jgi:hypothetical protein
MAEEVHGRIARVRAVMRLAIWPPRRYGLAVDEDGARPEQMGSPTRCTTAAW